MTSSAATTSASRTTSAAMRRLRTRARDGGLTRRLLGCIQAKLARVAQSRRRLEARATRNVERDACDDDAGPGAKRTLQPRCDSAVEDLMPRARHHELRQDHGDRQTGILEVQGLDVVT